MQQAISAGRPRNLSVSVWGKVAVTVTCLLIWRILAAIPLPIATPQLAAPEFQRTTGHGLLALLAGPPIERLSVVAMGLEPFLDAFVIFWLLGIVSSDARKARNDQKKLWQYLAWLTAGLAFTRAFGLTTLLLRGHPGAVTSSAGLTTIFALVLGSIGLFGMGRLIDRLGLPAGYGVWFLFGVDGLLTGVHSILQFVEKDAADPMLPAILMGYGLVSAVLVASTVLVFDGIRQVPLRKGGGKRKHAEEKPLPFHLLIGGFIIPVVMVTLAIDLPIVPLEGVLGLTPQQAAIYWSPDGPNLGVDVAFNAVYCLLIIGACFFTMYTNLDPKDVAKTIGNEGYAIPGVRPGAATASYISRVAANVTIIGGLWMAVVVVLLPVAFEALLGQSRPRLPLGGGPFVVTAAVLISAAKRLRSQVRA